MHHPLTTGPSRVTTKNGRNRRRMWNNPLVWFPIFTTVLSVIADSAQIVQLFGG